MNVIRPLDSLFFLKSNSDPYYVWHLPAGERVRLRVDMEEIRILRYDDTVVRRWEVMPSINIVGITITGYYMGDSGRFVTDTLYDLRDPYTEEEVIWDVIRATSLREFVVTFNQLSLDVRIVTQTLYGINLSMWGDRIDGIWAERVRRPYPIVGLVFYNREQDEVLLWYYRANVLGADGRRYELNNDSSTVYVLEDDELGWEDLAGAGITTMLAYVRARWGVGDRLTLPSTLSTLTLEQKVEIRDNLLLSPRQVSYLFAE